MLDNKSILITGGTGYFGRKFVEYVFQNHKPKRVVIFSRDELKQFEMQNRWSLGPERPIRYFIGDVRDSDRLEMAFEKIDYVIHAAALKHVPIAEYNPFEAIKTNILGAQNVINAAIKKNVQKVIALSTDKASAPVNLYGATKLASDKLFTAANHYSGKNKIKFSVVRYGNVFGSSGSVVPFFNQCKASGTLPITDERMTRFTITPTEAIEFVLSCLKRMLGGEIFVPKIPSYRILDLAQAIAPDAKLDFIGIRPGEKLHEEMITENDSLNCIEFEKFFVLLPSLNLWDPEKLLENSNKAGQKCKFGFSYNSGSNSSFLTIQKLKKLIRKI